MSTQNISRRTIELGSMPIASGKWECDDNEVDPNEIIIPEKSITVMYHYPFDDDYKHTHYTANRLGFTRKELSEQIMKRYRQMYDEEELDTQASDGEASGGRYGIWGHCIEDLQLHSLDYLNGEWSLGVDS
jgi:hypothetical protein